MTARVVVGAFRSAPLNSVRNWADDFSEHYAQSVQKITAGATASMMCWQSGREKLLGIGAAAAVPDLDPLGSNPHLYLFADETAVHRDRHALAPGRR
jgi:hypothetical protein